MGMDLMTFILPLRYELMLLILRPVADAYCVSLFTGDALHNLKLNLNDPKNVLQSWDSTLVNPCTWLHVTCNTENSVIRV